MAAQLGLIDWTKDSDKPISTAMQEALDELDEKKMDREDGKVLTDNNLTDALKEQLESAYRKEHEHSNKVLLDKLTDQDIDNWNGGNVLTKDNQTAYEPTQPYHPATVKYVTDTVKNVGAADMTKAVYDPQNKNRDIFKYVDDAVEDAMGNIPTPDVSGQISSHNTDSNAHRGMFAEADHSHTAAEVGAADKETVTEHIADVSIHKSIASGNTDITAGFVMTTDIYLVRE